MNHAIQVTQTDVIDTLLVKRSVHLGADDLGNKVFFENRVGLNSIRVCQHEGRDLRSLEVHMVLGLINFSLSMRMKEIHLRGSDNISLELASVLPLRVKFAHLSAWKMRRGEIQPQKRSFFFFF